MELISEETARLFLALLIGAIIGVEREYSSKAAGFRTMILICVGSALFTIISVKVGAPDNKDRIAANILTGIGFLGAGVVFKEGFNVVGITTAATIWVTAALGMAIGSGDYKLAIEGAVVSILVLFFFEYLQTKITVFHEKRSYNLIFFRDKVNLQDLENKLGEIRLSFAKLNETRNVEELFLFLSVSGSKKKMDLFNDYLMTLETLKSFDSSAG